MTHEVTAPVYPIPASQPCELAASRVAGPARNTINSNAAMTTCPASRFVEEGTMDVLAERMTTRRRGNRRAVDQNLVSVTLEACISTRAARTAARAHERLSGVILSRI